MSGRKNILVTFGFVLSVSLIASALAVMLVSHHYSRLQFNLLNAICGEMVEQEPEAKKMISAALKEYANGNTDGNNVLSTLGYRLSDFSDYRQNALFVTAGFLAGVLLFIFTFLCRNKIEAMRIQALAAYLEQVNTGKAVILSASGEDDFSKLEDEIYKTVTFLYQTKDAAVQARNDFAENLSNIAHQIKTPITAISLSVQMMKQDFDGNDLKQAGKQDIGGNDLKQAEKQDIGGNDLKQAEKQAVGGNYLKQAEKQNFGGGYLKQIEKQLLRLTYLEEALLVLSRIDAGTLLLQRNEVDVFTVLVLAADNLQELFVGSGTSIDIPELGGMVVTADLDWTMEAVMNLMKNCMEHSNGGTIHCSYAQNPLYTEILIWDDGDGFAKEDIPHLFERFYRGRNAGEGGIGIGLALAKEIMERQNGTIRAKNMPGGGACFEMRFY